MNPVFITGGTGYVGAPLIERLLSQRYPVHVLARTASVHRIPAGATTLVGDALEAVTFTAAIPPGATFVHLVGTPHPNPAKAAEFLSVDLASVTAAVEAARAAGVRHFVYVSVAHPAPVMRAYIAARQEGERLVIASGMRATILRPWYILGPGHWWPYALVPVYAALRLIPSTRAGAERLGLVSRHEMVTALVRAIEQPPAEGVRIMGVPEILKSAQ